MLLLYPYLQITKNMFNTKYKEHSAEYIVQSTKTKTRKLRTQYFSLRTSSGFTLIELLVAVGIVGIISVISLRSLYDILVIRAKQESLEETSDTVRTFSRNLSSLIAEAKSIYVPAGGTELRIIGNTSCQTVKYDAETKSILISNVNSDPCTPPDSNFQNVTEENMVINNLSFSPEGTQKGIVIINVEGFYKNALDNHEFSYTVAATPRKL